MQVSVQIQSWVFGVQFEVAWAEKQAGKGGVTLTAGETRDERRETRQNTRAKRRLTPI